MKLRFPSTAAAYRNYLAMSLGISVAGFSQNASAASSTWDAGAGTQDWNTATNWSGDTFPTGAWPDGVATVSTSTGLFPIISADPAFTPSDILVGEGGTNTGRLDQTAGTASTGDGNWMVVGRGGSSAGTYNLADTAGSGGTLTGFAAGSGSMTVGGTSDNGRLVLGDGGTSSGTLNMNTSGFLNAKQGLGILAATNGGTAAVNLDGGTINTAAIWFGDNNAASIGTLKMAGGTINTTAELILGRVTGTGIGTLSGGVLNVGGALLLAEGTGPANAAVGTLTVQTGATVTSTGDVRVLSSGNGSGTLSLSGGTLNVGPTGERWMIVGAYDSGIATVNISSGNLNLMNGTDLRFHTEFNSVGANVINQTGGTVTFYNDNGTTTAGSTGVLDMQRNGTVASSSTYHLSGGSLVVSQIVTDEIVAERGTRIFNFSGGTLKPTGSAANFMDAGSASRANVRNDGAVIDTNGFDITIGQALEHSDIGGDSATDGGLTKNGSGTLTLGATGSYTGNTTVTAGTLSLAAASLADASTVSIATGAVLDLTHGAIDDVAVLKFNNVTQAAGTYNSGNSGGFITGSGSIRVVAGATYATYASSHGLSAVPSDDTDADGVRNGVEYFLDASTGFTANPALVAGTVTWSNGGNIASSAYGTQFVVQTSPDLITWTDVPVGSLASNTSGPAGTLSYTPPTGQGKYFVRLVVTPN